MRLVPMRSITEHGFLHRVLYRNGDLNRDTATKIVWFLLLSVAFAGGLAAWVTYAVTGHRIWLALASTLTMLIGGAIAWLLINKRLTPGYVYYCVAVGMLCGTAADYALMAVGGRAWGTFILLIDGLLIADTPRQLRTACAVYVTFWIVLSSLELTFRFGMLDWEFLPPYEDRVVQCDRPPCAAGPEWLPPLLLPVLVVFLGDYKLTAWFADAAAAEERKVEAAVNISRDVASCLANFDLNGARRCLLSEEAHALPEELAHSYDRIIMNLHSYKPYVPSSVLGEYEEDADDADVSVIPGLTTNKAAIVFTDIRQSTRLWNHSPEAMKSALSIHNAVIRAKAQAHGGYEVKSMGDAFMFAFHSTAHALAFGIELQRALTVEVLWPVGLSRGHREDADAYDIFMIRVGMCSGAVEVERNFLTGRYDYFGPTVNKAARVEGLGTPGSVTLPKNLLEGIPLADMVCVDYVSGLEARGFDDEVQLTAVWREGIRSRDLMEAMCHNTCAALLIRPTEGAALYGTRMSMMMQLSVKSCSTEMGDHTGHHSPRSSPTSRCNLSGCRLMTNRAPMEGTVGHIAVRAKDANALDIDALQEAMCAVATCVERTRGLLSCVLSSTLCVTWGTGVRDNHMAAAARYVRLVAGALDDMPAGKQGAEVFSGLATGVILPGQVVGTVTQKVVTVMGSVVDLAALVSAAAMEMFTDALWAASSKRVLHDSVSQVALLLVDMWHLNNRRDALGIDKSMCEDFGDIPTATFIRPGVADCDAKDDEVVALERPSVFLDDSYGCAFDFESDSVHIFYVHEHNNSIPAPTVWFEAFYTSQQSSDARPLRDLAGENKLLWKVCDNVENGMSMASGLVHYLH